MLGVSKTHQQLSKGMIEWLMPRWRDRLRQCFLSCRRSKDHLEILLKTTFLNPSPDSGSLGEALRMCFSTKFPSDAHAAGPWATLYKTKNSSSGLERVRAGRPEAVCSMVMGGDWQSESGRRGYLLENVSLIMQAFSWTNTAALDSKGDIRIRSRRDMDLRPSAVSSNLSPATSRLDDDKQVTQSLRQFLHL